MPKELETEPMPKCLVSLTHRQWGWTAAEALRLGIGRSELLRRILDQRIDKKERPARRIRPPAARRAKKHAPRK
jgi:hypothetical protein